MANKNYVFNGFTEFLILSILLKKDSYVYEIVKSITDFSNGLLSISQNTIYTATYKLQSEGKISEYSKLVGKKRNRIYYHIEPSGKKYLKELFYSYKSTTKGVKNILSKLNNEGEITTDE